MAENVNAIAAKLGAVVVGQAPDAGGGAFGARNSRTPWSGCGRKRVTSALPAPRSKS